MHGAFLKKTLEKEKIGVLNLIEDEHYFTTLAFIAIDENGEREFSFSRKPGADTKLQADRLVRFLYKRVYIRSLCSVESFA